MIEITVLNYCLCHSLAWSTYDCLHIEWRLFCPQKTGFVHVLLIQTVTAETMALRKAQTLQPIDGAGQRKATQADAKLMASVVHSRLCGWLSTVHPGGQRCSAFTFLFIYITYFKMEVGHASVTAGQTLRTAWMHAAKTVTNTNI